MAKMRDKSGRPVVVVTGMGIVTSLGAGKSDNWTKLVAGQSGIKTIARFPLDGLKTTIAGAVDFISAKPSSSVGLAEHLGVLAGEEAISQAGIGTKGNFPGPLFIAAAPVELEWAQRQEMARAVTPGAAIDYDALMQASSNGQFREFGRRFSFGSIADGLSMTFGTKGSPITITTACASGVSAIQLGLEAIRRGETDAALCIATEASVNVETLVRFSLLSALSTQNDLPQQASKPFSKNRDGFVMAEGAGALVLESYESAQARGAKILGVVAGIGEKSDSFHRTRTSPDGKPVITCMQNALIDAGLDPSRIDHINAHGTSTPENDKMEFACISSVFGERATQIPVTSNKSMIGHTVSAAGAIEAIVSLLALEHQRIPPTINYDMPDPAIPLDIVGNLARDASISAVLSNSFGFGGQNVSAVLTREPL